MLLSVFILILLKFLNTELNSFFLRTFFNLILKVKFLNNHHLNEI